MSSTRKLLKRNEEANKNDSDYLRSAERASCSNNVSRTLKWPYMYTHFSMTKICWFRRTYLMYLKWLKCTLKYWFEKVQLCSRLQFPIGWWYSNVTWLVVALINTLVNFVRSNYASTPTYLKSHVYLVYVFNRWTWIRESMKQMQFMLWNAENHVYRKKYKSLYAIHYVGDQELGNDRGQDGSISQLRSTTGTKSRAIQTHKGRKTLDNRTQCERAIRLRGCGINCECGGIVRNDIFPDTLPYKYSYFSPWSRRLLTSSPDVCLVHDSVSIIISVINCARRDLSFLYNNTFFIYS